MTEESRRTKTPRGALFSALALGGALAASACAGSGGPSGAAIAPAPVRAATANAPTPDPRVGLAVGVHDAGEAYWNMKMVRTVVSPPRFAANTNTDLAFLGDYVLQGNYNGFVVWDVSNPSRPELVREYFCPASQSDVSVYGNLLFVSGEGTSGRLDCGDQGVPEPVSPERLRGIRIFDISDIRDPKYIHNVQTCRGSHTHTVVTDPRDPAHVYIYVSGSAAVRAPEELPGCSQLGLDEDPNSSLFRVEVIRVPLAAPQNAQIVTAARVFSGLEAAERRTEVQQQAARRPAPAGGNAGPNQCHDMTSYPAIGLAGGACQGYGILLDIRDPANPRRLNAVADTNFAAWHSVTFSNDGSKILFTDEWGGGTQPRCRASDNMVWGANAIFTLEGSDMEFKSYYKMPAAQTEWENCVAHNGSLVPVPGRDIKVQAWYQGGISVFDWTDPSEPVEIAFFDRGPLLPDTLSSAGPWSTYWYNGLIYSSEIARGLDILELTPSPLLTANEIEAAKQVRLDYFNAQEQQKFEWAPTFAVARAYLDQLQRSGGLGAERLAAVRVGLAEAERLSGSARGSALTLLSAQLSQEASSSSDRGKVTLLAEVVADLAAVRGEN